LLSAKAEGKGFEPSTGCPASDFEADAICEYPPGNRENSVTLGAEMGAVASNVPQLELDLLELIAAWPDLSMALRQSILVMVRKNAQRP